MSAKILLLVALMMASAAVADENPPKMGLSQSQASLRKRAVSSQETIGTESHTWPWSWSSDEGAKFQKDRAAKKLADQQAKEKQLATMLAEKKTMEEKKAAVAKKAQEDADARKAAEAKAAKEKKDKAAEKAAEVAAQKKAEADAKAAREKAEKAAAKAKAEADAKAAQEKAEEAAAKKKEVAVKKKADEAATAKAEVSEEQKLKAEEDAKAEEEKKSEEAEEAAAKIEYEKERNLEDEVGEEEETVETAAKAVAEETAASEKEEKEEEGKDLALMQRAETMKAKIAAEEKLAEEKEAESKKAEATAAAGAAPTTKVVKLLTELKARASADGALAQKTYDEYACWCESKLGETASAMNDEKKLISEMQVLIEKLKGELGAHGAEIQQLKKDIAQNAASVKEADQVRNNENGKYDKEKQGLEQQIGAMEAAIGVLANAGTKKGFLDTTTHQAQLLSVVGSIRPVIRGPLPSSISSNDVELMKQFVAKPEDFFSQSSRGLSAVQLKGPNPFGDYAPQSTQIQGVFKGMYDAFTADLEKANVEEAEAQKAFEAFQETKANEASTLSATLQRTEAASAEKNEELENAKIKRADTEDLLKTDEDFFEKTKDACTTKAKEWSVQQRLRTEELNGMAVAIKTLSGGADTFESSFSSFLELSATKRHQQTNEHAYEKLKALATKYKSMGLAKIAVAARESGHFDAIFPTIDAMVANLRKEEQADIEQRDHCEHQQNDNKNDIADLSNSIDKTDKALGRMENTKAELEAEINKLDGDIASTHDSIDELTKFRNKEFAQYQKALNDDVEASGLMNSAISSLSKFYKDNQNLLQMPLAGPEYTHDERKAPETSWSGANYGGRKSETTGIVAQLSMLVEDIEKEIKEGKADNADAQAKYEKQKGALEATADAQQETKVSTETELAELEERMSGAETFKQGKSDDKDAEGERKDALDMECDWVKTHFESRRKKRKNEIDGLADAKDFLAGGLR